MKNIHEPFKNIWQFLLLILIVGVICAYFSLAEPFSSFIDFVIGTIWSILIFITQWFGHALIQTKIAKHFTWIEKPFQRLVLSVISVIVYSIIAFLSVQALMNYLVFGTIPDYILEFNIRNWLVPIFISFFISLLVAAYGFFVSLKKSIIEREKLKREMLSYKYEALRNQINPHFMFNSLNVLSDLVYENQDMAVKFIHQFSDIYRYVLDSREKELVSLEEEVQFIEKFAFLLKIRFEEKLEININIPLKKDDLIVPLSLQLLIENAVKHNEISKTNPLIITVERIEDTIEVANAIKLKNISDDSKKIGLTNLQQQFSYFTDKKPSINENGGQFCVTIPILKKEH